MKITTRAGLLVTACIALGFPQSAIAEKQVTTRHSSTSTPRTRVSAKTRASGSPPRVSTGSAHATSATTAIVNGNADPDGENTTLRAEYALASNQWCASSGIRGTHAKTAPENLGSGNVMYSELSVRLAGLTPATEYCVELVAKSSSGTARGRQVRFTTPATAAQSTSPTSNTGQPSAPVSSAGGWPTSAVATVVILSVILLCGGFAALRPKLRPRRRRPTRPAAS